MRREEIVREIADDLKVRVQVIGLKRLAQETAQTYDELIAAKTPPEIAKGWLIINWMRERNDEERFNRGRSP
jgi:hypothetical protein